MHKGISFYFGWAIDPEERVKMIKESGFDSVITSTDKRLDKQNGKLSYQVKLFKKYGLRLSSLHMRYTSSELPFFWQEGKLGEKLKKTLIKDIKLAKKYGFTCVVVHILGEYSKIGEQRLKEILKYCDKVNIPIAIENLDNKKLVLSTFKNIKHDKLKFCYDSGHNTFRDKNYDYLNKFKKELITLHLHDNDGKDDLHTISRYHASVDWDSIAKHLSQYDEISLDYEILNRTKIEDSAKDFLKYAYLEACDLEKKILKYQKINKK